MICWPEEEEWWSTKSSVAQEGARHPELQTWFHCGVALETWLQTSITSSRKQRNWISSVMHELFHGRSVFLKMLMSSSQKRLRGQIQIGRLTYSHLPPTHRSNQSHMHTRALRSQQQKDCALHYLVWLLAAYLTSSLRKTHSDTPLGSLTTLNHCGLYPKYLASVPQHPYFQLIQFS